VIGLDLETTGLAPSSKILEIGMVKVDRDLRIVSKFNVLVFPPARDLFEPIALAMHEESGLLIDCIRDGVPLEDAIADACAWLDVATKDEDHDGRKSPMLGNSLQADRIWLAHSAPALLRYFDYRNLDVSSIRSAIKFFGLTDVPDLPASARPHRALDDLAACVDQLRFYCDRYFAPSESDLRRRLSEIESP
jgi:oligoribonuclease (3'-5' exoribonuclease)